MKEPEHDHLMWMVQKLAPGGKLLRSWMLEGGLSTGMTAFELETQEGDTRKMILRQPADKTLKTNLRAAEDEYRMLEILQLQGIASPKPVYLAAKGVIFPSSTLVLDYIEGKPEFDPANIVDYATQFAEHMASIHRVAGSNPDLSFLIRQESGCREMCNNPPTKSDTWWEDDHIRDVLESVWPFPQRNPPTLLHGDFWPGNVLWQDDKLVGVIDWEDATIGDPLIDLAISRLDLLWIFGADAMQAFTRHYQSLTDIETTSLPYWDLCAALRLARLAGGDLAAWVGFFHPYGRRDITAGTIKSDYRCFINQAFEKLIM